MKKHVKANVSWIGYMDWELKKFHGDEYSVDVGSSQNAYLIQEEKTVLMDTVWTPHKDEWLNNLKSEIDLNDIDYIVINHGECDHTGSLPLLMKEIPNTPIYCSALAVKSLEGQYGKQGWDFHVVKTGDTLDIGNGKELIFVEMKMLHWPDSMATYLTKDNILFSMDAFGQHFACGELFNDLADQDLLWNQALKYFVNILHPFKALIGPKLKEIENLNIPIDMIAPSHGVIWRDNPNQIIEAYAKWADPNYQEDQITIVYDTMWNGTEKLAHAIADEIFNQSPKTRVKVMSVAHEDKNDIMTEVFKSKAIAVGSPTCVNDVLTSVAGWLAFLRSLKFKNKKAAGFGCYGWSGESVKIIEEELKRAGFEVVDANVRSNWNPEQEDLDKVPALVSALLGEVQEGADEEEITGNAPGKRVYRCSICGWTYSEEKGDQANGIAPGTLWEDLPEDFKCPICKQPKNVFNEVE